MAGTEPLKGIPTGKKTFAITTPLQLTTVSYRVNSGVQLYNAGSVNVFIGTSSTITAGTTDSTDGYCLAPGSAVFLPVFDPSLIYGLTASGTAAVYYIAF